MTRYDAALCAATAVHVSNPQKLPPDRRQWVAEQREFWINFRRNNFPPVTAEEEGRQLKKINNHLYDTYDKFGLEERNLKLFDALQACRDRLEKTKSAGA